MKEKLIELLDETFDKQYDRNLVITAKNTADHLIANGVTIPVRCKDCKHYGYEPYDNGDKCCERWGEWIFPHDDDFCSCGERKDK